MVHDQGQQADFMNLPASMLQELVEHEKAAGEDNRPATRGTSLEQTMNLHDFYHDDGKADEKNDGNEDGATREQASSPDPAPPGSSRPRNGIKV